MARYASSWDPWRQLDSFQREMNRLLSGRWDGGPQRPGEFPAVNLWESDKGLALTAEVPGLGPEEIDITVLGDRVTLQGRIQPEPRPEGETFHRQERWTEPFSRTVQLPYEVDPEKTSAICEKGVLTIVLARPERQLPKKVSVRAQ